MEGRFPLPFFLGVGFHSPSALSPCVLLKGESKVEQPGLEGIDQILEL